MGYRSSLSLKFNSTRTSAISGIALSFSPSITFNGSMLDTSTTDKAEDVSRFSGTITSSGTEILYDLLGASTEAAQLKNTHGLDNPSGNTGIVWAKIKTLVIKNTMAATGNTLKVGGTGSNLFLGPLGGTEPFILIPFGGALIFPAPKTGWAVDATHRYLQIDTTEGTNVTFEVMIEGEV